MSRRISNNVNDLVYETIMEINAVGETVNSRNGVSKSIFQHELVLTNSRNRYLSLPERKCNIFQLIGETIWVLAGRNEIDPVLSFYLPRAANFSDDGVTWRGAYGGRLYQWEQLPSVIDAFVSDGLACRRAVVDIHMPHLDTAEALNYMPTKDIPCNTQIHFWCNGVEGEFPKFNMDVFQRSGDIFWGTGSINLFEFSFIHEVMFSFLKQKYPNLVLGHYTQRVTNQHFYPDLVGPQIEKLTSKDYTFNSYLNTKGKISLGNCVHGNMEQFFTRLYVFLRAAINNRENVEDVKDVETCVMAFLKNSGINVDSPEETLPLLLKCLIRNISGVSMPKVLFCYHPELQRALEMSSYRKFELV